MDIAAKPYSLGNTNSRSVPQDRRPSGDQHTPTVPVETTPQGVSTVGRLMFRSLYQSPFAYSAADSSSLVLESLEPEVILPSQFFEQIKGKPSAQPEKRLMLAVVEDAFATFQECLPGLTYRQRRLFKEVEEWFASTDETWPFSFQNICAALNLDADYLRLGLRRWKARQPAQQQRPAPITPARQVNDRRPTLSARERSCSQPPRRKAA